MTTTKHKHGQNRWLVMASWLSSAISECHKVNCRSKTEHWAKEIRKLHTVDGIPPRRIRRVLRWYCSVLPRRPKFLPLAESGRAFRQKFLRIERAMERSREDPRAIYGSGSDGPAYHRQDVKRARSIVERMGSGDIQVVAYILFRIRRFMEKISGTTPPGGLADTLNAGGVGILNAFGPWFIRRVRNWHGWERSAERFCPPNEMFIDFVDSLSRDVWMAPLSPAERRWLIEQYPGNERKQKQAKAEQPRRISGLLW